MKRKDSYTKEDKKRRHRNMTLEDAWRLFAVYDHNASLSSDRVKKIRKLILILGVIATTLALVHQMFFIFISDLKLAVISRILVILLPITISALLTISSKFERGVNWVLLRGSAEAVKHEIYRFRSQTGIYNEKNTRTESREIRLARMIKSINERLMKTEVNQSGLKPYKGNLPPPVYLASPDDDGFSYLTPSKYLECRLENQMNWYRKRTTELDKRIRRLHYQIILFGAVGTLLAAIGFEVWIAVTTAIVGAITSYNEYNQFEVTLTSYNLAATDLESIRIWWRALPENVKVSPETYSKLVYNTEMVMQSESQRWIQNMRDGLEELEEKGQDDAGISRSGFPRLSPQETPPSPLPQIPEDEGLTPVDLTPADLITGNWGGSEFPQVETPPPPIEKPEPGHFDLSPEDMAELDEIMATDLGKGEFFIDDRDQDTSSIDNELDDDLPDDTDLPFGDVDLNDEDVEVDDFVPGKVSSEDKSDHGSDNGEEHTGGDEE